MKLEPYIHYGKSYFKLFISWTVAVIFAAVALFVSSGTAYAGLFSFLAPIIEGNPASAEVVSSVKNPNSQNMALLKAAANIDPNPNKSLSIAPVAQNVLVPDMALNNATDTDQTSAQISTYVVREGDTVTGIAKMFNVTVNTVLWANNLTSKSVLQTGKTLVILPVSGIMYTVKKGDTVSSIAKKYGADQDDIASYNDLSVSVLAVGQSIIIPNAEIGAPQPAVSTSQRQIAAKERLLDDVRNLPAYPGYFGRPISAGMVSQSLHGHNAIDFAAPISTPILASAAGVVIINRINGGWNGGYGNFVVISHSNGTQTLYAHMQSRLAVSLGQQVVQGQTIGYIGMTGLTTGPHVHFEIRGAKNPF